MKKETLEEAAESLFNNFQKENLIVPKNNILPFKLGFIKGAKWQAERMYSEEEIMEAMSCTVLSGKAKERVIQSLKQAKQGGQDE
jgi:hypothetical protein